MSARIAGDRARRVVERPSAAAASTSARFGLEDGVEHGIVVDGLCELLEELGDLLVGAFGERCERVGRVCDCGRDQLVLGPRDVQQVPGVLDDHETVTGGERRGELG